MGSVQSQLDEYKKSNNRENRALKESMQISVNGFEEKVREMEGKTLWQITDCQNKLGDRVNEQFVRDAVREGEARNMTKIQAAMSKNSIDPAHIDSIESRCIKLEKELGLKLVEMTARLTELKDNIENSMATRKEVGQDKL